MLETAEKWLLSITLATFKVVLVRKQFRISQPVASHPGQLFSFIVEIVLVFLSSRIFGRYESSDKKIVRSRKDEARNQNFAEEAQWPIGYGVGLRIKWSSVRIRPWPLRWVLLGQGSLLPLSQGEAFTLAFISYLAILVKWQKKKKKKSTFPMPWRGQPAKKAQTVHE